MKTKTIQLTLSEAQYQVFAPAAKDLGTDVGSLLLAIACDDIEANPVTDGPYDEMEAKLWAYVHKREVPDVHQGWIEAGVEFFGQERSREAFLREVAS